MPAAPVASVAAYLAGLPAERRSAIAKVRDVVRKHLPPGFEEGIQFGMISWFIPPERYGKSYNAQPLTIAALASQKSYMALYLTGLYAAPEVAQWFAAAYKAAGKKLDMGKSCVRFHRLEDLPLDVVAAAAAKISVDDFIASYEKEQAGKKQKPIVMPGRKAASPTPASQSTPARKPASKPARTSAKPAPARRAKPAGTSASKLARTSASKPARTSAAKPAPARRAKPARTSASKRARTAASKPARTSAAKPAPARRAKPATRPASARKPAAKAPPQSPPQKRKA